jgi:hypothetical protein
MITIAWIVTSAFATPAQEPPARDWIQAPLKATLDRFTKSSEKQPIRSSTHTFTNAAFAALLEKSDAAAAERFLATTLAAQDMDAASKTYGQFKWTPSDAAVTDRNAVEFNMQGLAPLLVSHGNDLSAAFKLTLQPHLVAALAGMRAHRVSVSYTNIFLMKTVNLLLLGQAMHDDSAIADGRRMLDEWIGYTRQNGIHEFDSPTYYAVDLNSLVEGRRYAADAEDRQKFQVILDYFWTDIAANFFASGGKMGGPYSRDYAFLTGTGDMNAWLADAGWIPIDPKTSAAIACVFLADDARPGGYVVPAECASIARTGSREVVSNWDTVPGHTRWNWQDQHISLGCTSGVYGPQDKLFTAIFAGPLDQPQISLDIDAYDAPYGLNRQPDRSGHMKPVHLPAHLVSVQSKGLALLTLDVQSSALPADALGLTTNLLLPADASITIDGKIVSLASPTAIEVPPHDAVVTASLHGATVAIRLMHADSAFGMEAPRWSLVADAEGVKHHAVRLTLSHLSAGQKATKDHVRVALLIAAEEGENPATIAARVAQATLTDAVDGDVWTIGARLDSHALEVKRSLKDHDQIVSQTVDGQSVIPACLMVNGKDLAGPIWAGLPKERR